MIVEELWKILGRNHRYGDHVIVVLPNGERYKVIEVQTTENTYTVLRVEQIK